MNSHYEKDSLNNSYKLGITEVLWAVKLFKLINIEYL